MGTSLKADLRETLARDIFILHRYSTKLLVDGQALTAQEEADRELRVKDYMDLGDSLGLTPAELVTVVYADLLKWKASCGCPSCRAR